MTQVAQAQQPRTQIGNFLTFPSTKKFLEDNLKEHRTEFVSNLLSLCDGDANLAECEPHRLMMCAMNATALLCPSDAASPKLW